jgi:hypothetical protein
MYVSHSSESSEQTKSKIFDWMTKEIIEFELNNGWQNRLIVCAVQTMFCIKTNNASQVQKLKG